MQTIDVFILIVCQKCLVTLWFFRVPCEINDSVFCVQATFFVCLQCLHVLFELSMAKLFPVLCVMFEQEWLNHFEYARILVASGRREDAQRMERLWWEYFEAAAKAFDDARSRTDGASGRNHENTASCQCGKCRWFVEDTTLIKRITGYPRKE